MRLGDRCYGPELVRIENNNLVMYRPQNLSRNCKQAKLLSWLA
jgi:hypothetical protein